MDRSECLGGIDVLPAEAEPMVALTPVGAGHLATGVNVSLVPGWWWVGHSHSG